MSEENHQKGIKAVIWLGVATVVLNLISAVGNWNLHLRVEKIEKAMRSAEQPESRQIMQKEQPK